MNKRNWIKFNKLAEECYANKIGAYNDWHCWIKAFHQLRESILEERQTDPGFAPNLRAVDEATDFEYDIKGWLDDCLDAVIIKEEYELLLRMCDELLDLFGGEEGASDYVGSSKASALILLGRHDEALQYCRDWMAREPENISAALTLVDSLMEAGNYDDAKKLILQYIPEGTECDGKNVTMFLMASRFYTETGDDKALKKVEEELDKFLKKFKECVFDVDDDFIHKIVEAILSKRSSHCSGKKVAERRRESGKLLQ